MTETVQGRQGKAAHCSMAADEEIYPPQQIQPEKKAADHNLVAPSSAAAPSSTKVTYNFPAIAIPKLLALPPAMAASTYACLPPPQLHHIH